MVAVNVEATDLKETLEEAEAVVIVHNTCAKMVKMENAVNVQRVSVVNALKGNVVVDAAEVKDQELLYPTEKMDQLSSEQSEVASVKDTRANPVNKTTPSIVKMAQVVVDVAIERMVMAKVTGATRFQDQKTAMQLQLKVR